VQAKAEQCAWGTPKVVTIMGAPQEECAAEKAGQVREAVRK